MNGLPLTLVAVAVGGLIAAGCAFAVGYLAERRAPRRRTVNDVWTQCTCYLCSPPMTWTDVDDAMRRHPSANRIGDDR